MTSISLKKLNHYPDLWGLKITHSHFYLFFWNFRLVYPVKKNYWHMTSKLKTSHLIVLFMWKIKTFIGCSEVFRFIAVNKTHLLRWLWLIKLIQYVPYIWFITEYISGRTLWYRVVRQLKYQILFKLRKRCISRYLSW